MSNSNEEKLKMVEPIETAPPPAPEVSIQPSIPERLFRPIDWWTFAVTTFVVLLGYLLTVAPDLTLEDSGELAVGSFYAGVPHPPGYPVWTIYTWLFTKLLPFSNIAWRVAVSSAVAGAFSCGLLSLMVSRGSSMMIESIEEFRKVERNWENAICMVCGCVAGTHVRVQRLHVESIGHRRGIYVQCAFLCLRAGSSDALGLPAGKNALPVSRLFFLWHLFFEPSNPRRGCYGNSSNDRYGSTETGSRPFPDEQRYLCVWITCKITRDAECFGSKQIAVWNLSLS